jgi:ribosomal protein L22
MPAIEDGAADIDDLVVGKVLVDDAAQTDRNRFRAATAIC